MIRVKFLENHKSYNKGEVATLSPNEAFGLLDKGIVIVSKDMTKDDYKTSNIKRPARKEK